MGVYLSTPSKEKVSEDHTNGRIKCGASSMQGWRVNQEDAHNCCLDLTDSTSLFGVYDGHGGREVAIYTQTHYPDELKNNPKFLTGDYQEALVETFLSFDKKLVEPEVVAELKKIMEPNDSTPGEPLEEEEEEDIGDLREEANMPLEQLMQKYKKRLTEKDAPASPRLRAKRARGAGEAGCSSSSADTPSGSSSSQPGPSSSASGAEPADDDNEAMPSDVTTTTGSADSSRAQPSNMADACSSSTADDLSVGRSGAGSSGEASVSSSSNQRTSLAEKYSNGLVEDQDGTLDSSTDIKENGDGVNAGEVDDEAVTSTNQKKPPKKVITAADLFKRFATGAQCEDDSSSDSDENFPGTDESISDDENDDDDDDDGEGDGEDGEEEEEDEDSEAEMDDDEDDEFSMRMTNEPGMDSGCTAVVALVLEDKILVANAGDSRCVASCGGKAVDLSFDHKPEDEKELARITKAGGRVSADGRVNGGLNLSRALGDHIYKAKAELPLEEQMISPQPDIQQLPITDDLEFLILACDGIWNFMSSQEVIDYVRPKLRARPEKLSTVCEQLFEHCLAPNTMGDGTGCDNMTAVIVQFRPDQDLPDVVSSDDTTTPTTVADGEEKDRCEEAAPTEGQYSKRPVDDSSDGASLAKRTKTEQDFPQETP